MRRAPARWLSLALPLACLALAGCSATGQAQGGGGAASAVHVDVGTPRLQALKAAAKVEPCRPGRTAGDRPAGDLPRVTLACLGGGPDVDLSALRGPLVINLFAQWCGPCRAEMPYYQALHEKARGVVDVLGVDYLDTQPAAALDLVKQAGVTYPLLADPAGTLRPDFKIRGLPGVVLVDRDGKVVDVEFRVVRSYAELRDLVRQHLHVAVPS